MSTERDPEKPISGFDYAALATGVDQLREALRAMVAGIVADGFTDREARVIVAGMFATMKPGDDA